MTGQKVTSKLHYFVFDDEIDKGLITYFFKENSSLILSALEFLCFKKEYSTKELERIVQQQNQDEVKFNSIASDSKMEFTDLLGTRDLSIYWKLKREQFDFNYLLLKEERYSFYQKKFESINCLLDKYRFSLDSTLLKKQPTFSKNEPVFKQLLHKITTFRNHLKIFLEENFFNPYLTIDRIEKLLAIDQKIWDADISIIKGEFAFDELSPLDKGIEQLTPYLENLITVSNVQNIKKQIIVCPELSDFSVYVVDITWDNKNEIFKVIVLNLESNLKIIDEQLQDYFEEKKWKCKILSFESPPIKYESFNLAAYLFCREMHHFTFEDFNKKELISRTHANTDYLYPCLLPDQVIALIDEINKKKILFEEKFKRWNHLNLFNKKFEEYYSHTFLKYMQVKVINSESLLYSRYKQIALYRKILTYRETPISYISNQYLHIKSLFSDLTHSLNLSEPPNAIVGTHTWLFHYENDIRQPFIIYIEPSIAFGGFKHKIPTGCLNIYVIDFLKNPNYTLLVFDIHQYFKEYIEKLMPKVTVKFFIAQLHNSSSFVFQNDFIWKLAVADQLRKWDLSKMKEKMFAYHRSFFRKNEALRGKVVFLDPEALISKLVISNTS